jgi:AraC family transcriptional regulator
LREEISGKDIDIRGGISMEFKIEKKEKFNLVGLSKRVPIQF